MFGSEKVDDQEGQVFPGEVHDDPGHAHDAVFGRITNDGPNYRNVSRDKPFRTKLELMMCM